MNKKSIKCEFKISHNVNSFIADDINVDICDICPKIDSKKEKCKTCYGRVLFYTLNNDTYLLRDYFSISESGEIIENLEATKFINKSKKIIELSLYQNNCLHLESNWSAADRPYDYKTACDKCKQNNEVPQCKKNKKIKIGKLILNNFCNKQKQRIMKV